jgi:hypothetical protein
MKSSKMTYPSKIETPFPSVEEIAKILGVPLVRAKRLSRMNPSRAEQTVSRNAGAGRTSVKNNAKKSRASKSR